MPKDLRVSVNEKDGTATYIVLDNLSGLISLVQTVVLEIHPSGSREDNVDRPDRLILDMDPAPDRSWADVVREARKARDRLENIGLESFVRTTGGKGLHVVAPLARRSSWPEVKAVAKAIADSLVRDEPDRFIAQSSRPGAAARSSLII